MNDAWANSADTTPPTAADGWDPTNNQTDRDPYTKGNDTALPLERESRRGRSRSPARNGADQRGRDYSGNPGTNLHISGLHPRVTERHLEDAFSKYGKVEKAQVVYDPHTRDSRCFGFVMMKSLESAEAAITGLNGYVLEGSALRVDKVRRNVMKGHIRRASMIIATVGMMIGVDTTNMTAVMANAVMDIMMMIATAEIDTTGTSPAL
ncbi:RNA recognition motif, putative, partial [Rhizoctonia solani AG-3 Rhs1AP]